MEDARKKIMNFIKKQAGTKSVVIGLSGGLDSSVVAFLAVEALGKEKVFGIISPSEINTKQDLKLAALVANLLEIEYQTINIDNIVNSFYENCDFYTDKTTAGNLKARIRMCMLYGKANQIKGLVLGTGNKTELMTGYFTKHGDGAADILPIGGLYKTQERKLAKLIGVPEAIINRRPTASLWENQYDENGFLDKAGAGKIKKELLEKRAKEGAGGKKEW